MTNEEYENIRTSFKPETINVLYIGESRPAGGTFFYLENSILYSAITQAYFLTYSKQRSEGESFLSIFKKCGCYLDDLCLEPVNKLSDTERLSKRIEYVDSLAKRISEYNPKAICLVIGAAELEVKHAIKKSAIKGIKYYQTNFPWRSDKRMIESIEQHNLVLTHLMDDNIITYKP